MGHDRLQPLFQRGIFAFVFIATFMCCAGVARAGDIFPAGHAAMQAGMPVDGIQDIIQAKGMVSNGVLSIEIDRNDIRDVHLRGVPILPSFEINGTLNFQSIGNGQVAMNSDLCVKENEIDPFIDQLLEHGIAFQAEHQHFYDFDPRDIGCLYNQETMEFPQLFFSHEFKVGNSLELAKEMRKGLDHNESVPGG